MQQIPNKYPVDTAKMNLPLPDTTSKYLLSFIFKHSGRKTDEYSENKIAQSLQYRSSPLIAKTRSEWHVTCDREKCQREVHLIGSPIKSIKNSESAACMFYYKPSEKQLAVWVTRRHNFHLNGINFHLNGINCPTISIISLLFFISFFFNYFLFFLSVRRPPSAIRHPPSTAVRRPHPPSASAVRIRRPHLHFTESLSQFLDCIYWLVGVFIFWLCDVVYWISVKSRVNTVQKVKRKNMPLRYVGSFTAEVRTVFFRGMPVACHGIKRVDL